MRIGDQAPPAYGSNDPGVRQASSRTAIVSFADTSTQDIFHGIDSKAARRIPREIWPKARRQLDMINAAHTLQDLGKLPGNRLEKLRGNLLGKYSIRVNSQYRIVFAFNGKSASAVEVTDYH
jgi:proteic killer suppression protein